MLSWKLLVPAALVIVVALAVLDHQVRQDRTATTTLTSTQTVQTASPAATATPAASATATATPAPATGKVQDVVNVLGKEGDDTYLAPEESDSSLVGADSSSISSFDQSANVSNNDL